MASSNNERYAILMNNIPSSSSNFTRTFKIDSHIISLFSHKNVVQASFFDLYDDVISFHYFNYKKCIQINIYNLNKGLFGYPARN